jgi:hypothetical protein
MRAVIHFINRWARTRDRLGDLKQKQQELIDKSQDLLAPPPPPSGNGNGRRPAAGTTTPPGDRAQRPIDVHRPSAATAEPAQSKEQAAEPGSSRRSRRPWVRSLIPSAPPCEGGTPATEAQLLALKNNALQELCAQSGIKVPKRPRKDVMVGLLLADPNAPPPLSLLPPSQNQTPLKREGQGGQGWRRRAAGPGAASRSAGAACAADRSAGLLLLRDHPALQAPAQVVAGFQTQRHHLHGLAPSTSVWTLTKAST